MCGPGRRRAAGRSPPPTRPAGCCGPASRGCARPSQRRSVSRLIPSAAAASLAVYCCFAIVSSRARPRRPTRPIPSAGANAFPTTERPPSPASALCVLRLVRGDLPDRQAQLRRLDVLDRAHVRADHQVLQPARKPHDRGLAPEAPLRIGEIDVVRGRRRLARGRQQAGELRVVRLLVGPDPAEQRVDAVAPQLAARQRPASGSRTPATPQRSASAGREVGIRRRRRPMRRRECGQPRCRDEQRAAADGAAAQESALLMPVQCLVPVPEHIL